MLEHTCSPAQSREGSAASRLLLLIPGSSNTANVTGIVPAQHPEGSRIRPSPRHRGRDGVQPAREIQQHPAGKGGLVKRGRRSPLNGNSNRSCTNGSLITINYHFRLPSSALNHCSAFFVPPFYPTTHLAQDKGKETRNCKRSSQSPCLRQDHMATRVY